MLTTLVALVNSLLMIGMPVLLGIWLARRLRAEWRVFGLGMATFVASQVLHIPFNLWLLNPLLQRMAPQPAPGSADLMVVAILLGLSAGVFEESARLVMLRGPLRQATTWSEGLMFGAGHGGVEAILLGLLTLYSLVQLVALRDVDLAAALEPAQVESVSAALVTYWGAPWYEHLLPALERAFALCLHIGLSILVLEGLVRRNYLWFVLAVLWHAAVDAVAVFALSTWGAYVTEALVGIAALLSLGIVLWLRPKRETLSGMTVEQFQGQPAAARAAGGLAAEESEALHQREPDLDPEALERSRYRGIS